MNDVIITEKAKETGKTEREIELEFFFNQHKVFAEGLADFVKRFRSKTVLASCLNCSLSNLNFMLNGRSFPTYETLIRLINEGMSLEGIFGKEVAQKAISNGKETYFQYPKEGTDSHPMAAENNAMQQYHINARKKKTTVENHIDIEFKRQAAFAAYKEFYLKRLEAGETIKDLTEDLH